MNASSSPMPGTSLKTYVKPCLKAVTVTSVQSLLVASPVLCTPLEPIGFIGNDNWLDDDAWE